MKRSYGIGFVLLCSTAWAGPSGGAVTPEFDLIGIHADTGELFAISASNAAVTPLGSTGIGQFGSLELSPEGILYGVTGGTRASLYAIDPLYFSATMVGSLNMEFVFEGSLVFSPQGTVYATNGDSELNPQLLTIDVLTGEADVVGTISGGRYDINAMAWRDDGMLVGLDRFTNTLLAINPADASSSLIAPISVNLGAVGGMAVLGDTAYFVTGGPAGTAPGSNELYTVDLYSGAHTLVGSLSPTITGTGISGLAVPEPTSLLLLVVGGGFVMRRR
jgi:hypothetical protein